MPLKVYLDFAATTPVREGVILAMAPFWQEKFGNPSSVHAWGREAKVALEESRNIIAGVLGARQAEILFTSCGTEASNLAIKGLVESSKRKPHLICSPIEHHCVLETVRHLEKKGRVEVNWLKVDGTGLVDPKELISLIRPNTLLVAVMFGNNEVGTIEPVVEIGKLLAIRNSQFATRNRIYFYTDAVQTVQYLDCNVNRLGVDLLSLTAHKFGGPKGVGVLYVRGGTPLVRQQDGGGQERNLRAGTENLAYIVGMAKALELVVNEKKETAAKITELRDKLIKGVLEKISGAVLTGHSTLRLPHIASFLIPGIEAESALLLLDEEGIAASSGSACTSGSLEPSPVLIAMGYTPFAAHGSLRFSLGKATTEKEIDYVLQVLPGIVEKLRKIAPKL